MKRKRTRQRKRHLFDLNKAAFLCLILSVIYVCVMFIPKDYEKKNAEVKENSESKLRETETGKYDSLKLDNGIKNVSSISSYGYTDIESAENKSKELLNGDINGGKIFEEDYFCKNATSSCGSVYLRNTTKNHSVDIEKYLKKDIPATVNKNSPVVLIYHTHASESYLMTESKIFSEVLTAPAETLGVVRAGDALCRIIEKSGYTAIHDKTVYDESYSGAFERSRTSVSEILKANPSIQFVIDLHRDSISRKDGSKIKTVTEINGKKTAQIEITSGCQDGLVTGFPNWEKNLTFAVHLQNALSNDYSHIARPIFFCARKYNMDLVPCALNISIGTDANTVRESVYAAEILGEEMVKIIKECENI